MPLSVNFCLKTLRTEELLQRVRTWDTKYQLPYFWRNMTGRGRGRGRKIQDEPERWGLWLLMKNIQKICMVHVVLSNSPSCGFNLDSCVVSGTSTCQQIQAALVPMTTKRQHPRLVLHCVNQQDQVGFHAFMFAVISRVSALQ